MSGLTPADWIALSSSIGTLFSSVFVLVTILEMKTQRKQSYMPDLVIPDVCFWYNNDEETYMKMWVTDDKEMLKLKILNVGLGVAKDINFSWKYDVEHMMSTFHSLREAEERELYIDSETQRIHHSKDGTILNGSSLSVDAQHVEFLLPFSADQDTTQINLPNSYMCISTAILKTAFIDEIFDLSGYEKSLTPLTLTITCKDVGGRAITKKYNVDVRYFIQSINRRTPQTGRVNRVRARVYVSDY